MLKNTNEVKTIIIEIYAEFQREEIDADQAEDVLVLENGEMDEDTLESLHASMCERGFDEAYPVLMSDINQLWGGRHRLAVAIDLEIEEIHALIVPHSLLSRLEDEGAELEDMMTLMLKLRDLEDERTPSDVMWRNLLTARVVASDGATREAYDMDTDDRVGTVTTEQYMEYLEEIGDCHVGAVDGRSYGFGCDCVNVGCDCKGVTIYIEH